jgi:flagellar biosynthetic protein FliO
MRRLLSVAVMTLALTVVIGASARCVGKDGAIPVTATHRTELTPGKSAPVPETDFLASLEASEKKDPQEKPVPVYKTAFGLIFKLALVLGLVYLTVLGLKKFTTLKTPAARPGQHIRVLENSMLAANRSLHIVEIGSRKIVIGSTPNQVSMIAELPEESREDAQAEESGFRNHLVSFLNGKKAPVERETARTVAQMLRESNDYLQDKVRDVGTIRGKVRD